MPTPAELADQYLAGAKSLREAVKGMTREQLTARPIPGKWSTLEVVCHLADFEPDPAVLELMAAAAGAWVAKESPGYLKGLYSSSKAALTFAKASKIKVPGNAESMLDSL